MGRRKHTDHNNAVLAGVVLLVMLGLLGMLQNHPGTVAVLVAAPTLYFGLNYLAREQRFDRARKLTQSHAQELAIKRRQLLGAASYGIVDSVPWSKEVGRFIDKVIAPTISGIAPLRGRLQAMVDEVAAAVVLRNTFYAGMPPSDYEHFVSAELQRLGWVANVSGKTGDQGVDVLATKGRVRLVVQCKLYSKPVGNAAVQEAIAGRGWESATHAIVVSNASFTKSAQQLASSQGVLLMHHDQLPDLEARLIES